MTLGEIRDWLKTFGVAENYYCNKLDNKKDKSLGVYDITQRGAPVMALGGIENSSYDWMDVSLLLHWNRTYAESQLAASRLWNAVFGKTQVDVPGGSRIQYIQLLVPKPLYVDTDENGVHEFIIEMKIYFRR